MAEEANFILGATNWARLDNATLAGGTEAAGLGADQLKSHEESQPWQTLTLQPWESSLHADYGVARPSRALCLHGGNLIESGLAVRVTRGRDLGVVPLPCDVVLTATNATDYLDVANKDARTALFSTYATPTDDSLPMEIRYKIEPPERALLTDASQQQIWVYFRPKAGAVANPGLAVYVRRSAAYELIESSVIDLDVVTGPARIGVRFTLGAGVDDPPRISVIVTPAGTSTLEIAAVTWGAAYNVKEQHLEMASEESLTNATGTLLTSVGNPQDINNFVSAYAATAPIAAAILLFNVRVPHMVEARSIASCELAFSYQDDAFAAGVLINVDLYEGGAKVSDIADITTSDGDAHAATATIDTSALTDPAAMQIWIRITGGSHDVQIGQVMVYMTLEDPAVPESWDSGWIDAAPAALANLAGGYPGELLTGRSREIDLIYDFRSAGLSTEVWAPETYVELWPTLDPDDPETELDFMRRLELYMEWRYYQEGPGLAGMQLQRGLAVAYQDPSVVKRTIGNRRRTIVVRSNREVSFEIGNLPPLIGPGELGELLDRVGVTEPLIFVVLPTDENVRQAFSMIGTVSGARLAHSFSTRTDGRISIVEL